jgi:hydroxymethylglutaryl-CoA synthase
LNSPEKKNEKQETENGKPETDPGHFSFPVFCFRFPVSGSFLFGSGSSGLGEEMGGLIAYGAYIPYNRLKRSEIAAALGAGGGRGTRAVASYDEDTTSLGVEAARAALRMVPAAALPRRVYFATSAPAYLDKTNATAIQAALDLDESVLAVDMAGAVRSGVGALLAAADAAAPTMAVLSDVRTGLPGGADERDGGDAAAAFVFGECAGAPPLAEIIAHASATAEILDRWRLPGGRSSRVWEERFGEHVYGPLAARAFTRALEQAGLAPEQVDHLVVTGVHARAVRQFAASCGARREALADDLSGMIGNAGTAHPGVMLADVLDRAEPDRVIALVLLADGASVLLLRTKPALADRRAASPVAAQIAAGNDALRYTTFLSWRGMLEREPPRRPDPEPPYAPPSYRREDWKFAFVATRCRECGTRHLPPDRVCVRCRAVDRMDRERLADVPATVATFTIDRLAYTPSPPLVAAVIDFDGGGRFRCQLTDVEPDKVAIGDRVEMTFRKIVTAAGIHNYFWKARPIRAA